MTVKLKTWTQRHFNRPNIDLARPAPSTREDPNSVAELSCLAPDPITGNLKRGPAWTQAAALTGGFNTLQGAFYDEANGRYCFIGATGAVDLSLIYTTDFSSWSGPYDLITGGIYTLGGQWQRNVAFWGGYLWVIDNNGDIYRGTDYTAALASFYTTTDAEVLAPMNDRMFAADTNGDILRLTSTPAMGTYHDALGTLNPIFMTPFRQYMTVVCEGDDDTLNIFRLPDYAAHGLHQLASIPTPGFRTNLACPIAHWHDEIVTLTGQQKQSDGTYDSDLYAFNGHETRRIARVRGRGAYQSVASSGLLVWNGELIFYDLDNDGVTGHDFQILVGEEFVDYAPLASKGGAGSLDCMAFALADVLVVNEYSGAAEHIHYARRDSLADGYVVLSRQDFGHPGRLKRLEQITVILDGAASDFDVIIKYRTDDTAAWTTAATESNTRIARATEIGATFYLLQIRVDLDDDTGNDEDIGIQAVNVIYTVDE